MTDISPDNTANPLGALQLNATEARILGSLIEKQATTPETYPLTVNSLVLACNQKTSRDPVMQLTPGEVGNALRRMEPRGLVKQLFGSRADRYEHRFSEAFSVTQQQQAVLATLLLRGPQTSNELLVRSERLARFAVTDDVAHALERLAERAPPLIVVLPRQPGQREDRYMHLLCGPVAPELLTARVSTGSPRAASSDLEQRVEQLEALTRSLQEQIDALRG